MNTVQNIGWSQIRCIFCRPDLYNIKARKMLKTYIIVRNELSMNENTRSPQTKTMLNPPDMSELC